MLHLQKALANSSNKQSSGDARHRVSAGFQEKWGRWFYMRSQASEDLPVKSTQGWGREVEIKGSLHPTND